MTIIRMAISPCPNDTFMFHALFHGLVKTPLKFDVNFFDIQRLNEDLLKEVPDLTKASYASIREALSHYTLLPVGTAVGRGSGPKIVARKKFPIEDLKTKKIAIPGKGTTAYLLYQKLTSRAGSEFFCSYDEIFDKILSDQVDCGIIIHESRFVFGKHGLVEITDLGELWEKTYDLPLPLGGLVVKKSLGTEIISELTLAIRESIRLALENPSASLPFILEHSIEKDLGVIRSHIELFANQESYRLSPASQRAIALILED
ncbi:MAG: 1,4-dihydroxy-6-naphthoate synthase [Oligoflexales bacterium]|nr:1,4-dihydroxy-6-naphthoate synthase [Oligoflexales bacterium]